MASKETSTRGTGKGQKLLSGTRDQLIKDLQRVHKVFPTAEPDRDFYRVARQVHRRCGKVHFSRFKDFAAAAVPEMTPDEAFKLAVRSLDRAIDLIQKWHEDAEYGEGWVKHQIDAVNARVHELDELFYIWRLIKEMDKEEEAAKAEPEITDRGAARPGIFEGETMNIENMEYAIKKAEHLLLVLKRMKDDPQGDHWRFLPSTDPAKMPTRSLAGGGGRLPIAGRCTKRRTRT